MAYLLRFHPDFISELEKAILYYSSESGKLAEKFKIATRKQLTGLKRNPHLRSVRYADVRFARVEKFPYAIHYSMDDSRKEVYSCVAIRLSEPRLISQKTMVTST